MRLLITTFLLSMSLASTAQAAECTASLRSTEVFDLQSLEAHYKVLRNVDLDPIIEEFAVQVKGALQGTGTIVVYDDEPMILTNSHIVQDRTQLEIVDGKNKIPVTVAVNRPDADFALLALPKGATNTRASFLQRSAYHFYRKQKNGTPTSTGVLYTGPNSFIISAEDGTPRITTSAFGNVALDGNQVIQRDDYIGASLNRIIVVPFYSRPGMSGGAFFGSKLFTGIVTRVDVGGAHDTYVIPAEEIQRILSSSDSSNSSEKFIWKSNGPGQTSLFVQTKSGKLLEASSQAGQTGIAGGDGSVGGGDGSVGGGDGSVGGNSKSSKIWTFKFSRYIDKQRFEHQIANPFESGNRSFKIDGKEISYFEINGKFQAATAARYIRSERESQNSVHAIEKSSTSADRLMKARLKALVSPTLGRTYVKSPDGTLSYAPKDSYLYQKDEEWTQALTSKDGYFDVYYFRGTYPPDAEVSTVPLKAKPSRSKYIDVTLLSNLQISAPKDLSKFEIKLKDGKDPIFLEMQPSSKGSPNLIYRSSDGKYRAAVIFDEKNLAQAERTFIETPENVVELIHFDP